MAAPGGDHDLTSLDELEYTLLDLADRLAGAQCKSLHSANQTDAGEPCTRVHHVSIFVDQDFVAVGAMHATTLYELFHGSLTL